MAHVDVRMGLTAVRPALLFVKNQAHGNFHVVPPLSIRLPGHSLILSVGYEGWYSYAIGKN